MGEAEIVEIKKGNTAVMQQGNEKLQELQKQHGQVIQQCHMLNMQNEQMKKQFFQIRMEYERLKNQGGGASSPELLQLREKVGALEKEKQELMQMLSQMMEGFSE